MISRRGEAALCLAQVPTTVHAFDALPWAATWTFHGVFDLIHNLLKPAASAVLAVNVLGIGDDGERIALRSIRQPGSAFERS
jgi:hypothetical protein